MSANRFYVDRRLMLASLAGAVPLLVAGRANAQGTTAQGTTRPATSPSGGIAASSANQALGEILVLGTLSLESCKAAETKAQSAAVKKFAQLEASEQQTVAEVLLANGAVAVPLPPDMQQKLKQLQSLSGQQFDAMFVQEQLKTHEQLLARCQSVAQGQLTEPTIVLARLGVDAINSHIAMLNMIQQTG